MSINVENKEIIKTFDVEKIRNDFPILKQTVHGKPLVYFDNAATTQKPQVVMQEAELTSFHFCSYDI